MTEDVNDIFEDDQTTDGNVPPAYRNVQTILDQFAAVSYDAAYNALQSHSGSDNADYLRERIVTILRNNPPFATIPKYLRDGRENYLWYSDFYDDTGKDVFRKYGQSIISVINITPANYATELAKIALPYFSELVDLVSLEKLYMEIEERMGRARSKSATVVIAEGEDTEVGAEETHDTIVATEQPQASPEPTPTLPVPEQLTPEIPAEMPKRKPKQLTGKRSYEPKLNPEQYSLLAECVENIRLFRRPTPVSELKKLLTGKLAEPLQVTNQNSLTHILDKLRDNGLVRWQWQTVAVGNKDFLSFRRGKNKQRYGDEPHHITMQQFSNCRQSNRTTGFKDLLAIDEMMEKILACGGK
jgi:hypothetical protein